MVVKKQKHMAVSQEQYERIMKKYSVFSESMGDPDKVPVSPFYPLHQKAIEELELIREVSRELQRKKDEDINKAAQAAKEAEEAAAKKVTEVEHQEEKIE